MNVYMFEVVETLRRSKTYHVKADSVAQARELAEAGDTFREETDGKAGEIVERSIVKEWSQS